MILPRSALALALVLLALGPASAAGPGAKPASKFVRIEGTKFVRPDGSPLPLRGINLGCWLLPEGYMFGFKRASSPRLIQDAFAELVGEEEARAFWRTFRERYVTREDIAFVKRAGFDHVRVPFDYRILVTNDDERAMKGPGWKHLDDVVEWCRAEGLYVILDMHAAPGGQTGDNIDNGYGYPFLFDDEASQALTVRIWEAIATRYADEPTVVGYDLLNEPIAHFFDVAAINPKLEPLYKRIVAGIRKHDREHVVFLGGAQWDSNFAVFGPPFDDKAAYTFHKYWTEPTKDVIADYLAYRDRYKVPVWCGETGENTNEWISAFRKTLEDENVAWTFWTYKRLDADRCVASIAKPADWQAVVDYADAPRSTFEEIRKIRPSRDVARRALAGYLDNLPFARCRVNEDYLKALGLHR